MTDLLAELVLDARPPCITEHPDFANVCLCRAVLTVSTLDNFCRDGAARRLHCTPTDCTDCISGGY